MYLNLIMIDCFVVSAHNIIFFNHKNTLNEVRNQSQRRQEKIQPEAWRWRFFCGRLFTLDSGVARNLLCFLIKRKASYQETTRLSQWKENTNTWWTPIHRVVRMPDDENLLFCCQSLYLAYKYYLINTTPTQQNNNLLLIFTTIENLLCVCCDVVVVLFYWYIVI